ncbi:MAG: ferritin family protein [Planctomycetota bacterium]|jgi:rubrerythrin
MAEFESYDEILELAIAREEDASKFYLALAARVQRPEMRKVFEELAGEELEHKAKLELEVMKTGRVVTAMQDVDIGIERAVGFNKADLDMDYKDVLIIAMQKEESAFKLYVDLAGRVTNEDSKETLLALAQEEVKHKLRFEMEYENLLKTG